MELSVRHLRIVVAIGEAGGISRAAATLGVAQPSLTTQLKRIERDLGAVLFRRRPDGVTPTELGHFFLSGARDILVRLDDLVNSTRALGREKSMAPAVRIGATGNHRLPAIMTALAELMPGREQFVTVEPDSEEVLTGLRHQRFDLGVVTDYAHLPQRRQADLAEYDLGEEQLVICLSQHHALAGFDSVTLPELAEETWVIPGEYADAMRLSLRMACERTGFSPHFRHVGLDRHTAAVLIRVGQSIGVFPEDGGPGPGNVFVRLADGELWRRTRLAWPTRSPLAPIVTQLAERIRPAAPSASGAR